MKRILTILMVFLFLICLTGCGKETKSKVMNKIDKKVNNLNGYKIDASMEIVNNEDVYKYDVSASYKKKDYYRVALRNKTNNHEQIILKNKDGVYVLTPNLNKSFKFQSRWPYNGSQSYLIQSVVQDMKKDKNLKMKKKNGKYIFTSTVNYKNNPDLIKQIVVFDKNLNIKKVTVYNNNDEACIKVVFNDIDMKAKFKDDYFNIEENMEMSSNVEETTTEEASKLEEAIYPMYLPEGTYLDTEKTVELDNGNRIILTFKGDESFMLVEETAQKSSELSIVPTSGDLNMLSDTIAIVGDTSVNWITNGIEYYLVSSDMSGLELLEVAKSISAMPISK